MAENNFNSEEFDNLVTQKVLKICDAIGDDNDMTCLLAIAIGAKFTFGAITSHIVHMIEENKTPKETLAFQNFVMNLVKLISEAAGVDCVKMERNPFNPSNN